MRAEIEAPFLRLGPSGCRNHRETGEAARKASHGVTVPGRATTLCRLRDEDGLIALAEPRGGATLKPVVGFRA